MPVRGAIPHLQCARHFIAHPIDHLGQEFTIAVKGLGQRDFRSRQAQHAFKVGAVKAAETIDATLTESGFSF